MMRLGIESRWNGDPVKVSYTDCLDQHNVTGFSLFHSDESLMDTLAIREFTLRRQGRVYEIGSRCDGISPLS